MSIVQTQTSDINILQLKALGYSQKEISKKTNVSNGFVSRKLHGFRKSLKIEKNQASGFADLFIELSANQIFERLATDAEKGVDKI